MEDNYLKLLERVSRASGVEKSVIEQKVSEKREKLSGLISKEGALQVVSGELGISLSDEKMKINELVPGMRKVRVSGQVVRLFPVRSFTTNKGVESKVTNIILADETSNIRVVLWDTNHVGLIEKGEIQEGTAVEIANASMRDNELHLGSFSELKKSDISFANLKTERIVHEKKISTFAVGDSASVRAFIVQVFDPRFFYVCPECKKKVVSGSEGFICAEHNLVTPEKRIIVNLVIDDGTEAIRAVLFNDVAKEVGVRAFEDLTLLQQQKENLLGAERIFAGNVRMNTYFNNPEFIVDKVEEVNLDNLLEKLDSR